MSILNSAILTVETEIHQGGCFNNLAYVTATAYSEEDKAEKTYIIQLEGYEYRPALGCKITDTKGNEITEVDEDLFDFRAIVEAAEEAVLNEYNPIDMGDYTIISANGDYLACTRNEKYLNADATPFTLDFVNVVFESESLEEVERWIEENE